MKQSNILKTVLGYLVLFMMDLWMGFNIFANDLPVNKRERLFPKKYFAVETFPFPWNEGNLCNLIPIDFDNDGDLDVIVTQLSCPPPPTPYGNALLIALRNDGQGHFSDVTTRVFFHDTATFPSGGLAEDFNHDGLKDLFLPDGGDDRDYHFGAQNQIFIQTPRGRLRNETRPRLPDIMAFTYQASAGDIDHDGDLDIYCAPGGPIPLTPFFLINDGKGYFTFKNDNLPADMTKVPDWYDHRYDSALLVDVDKDGDMDVVLGATGWRENDRILLNDGNGYFNYAPDNSMPPKLCGKNAVTDKIMSADFNKDGWPDLIMNIYDGQSLESRVQLLLNNCNGTFRDATNNIPNNVSGIRPVEADLNNDGWMDFIGITERGPKIYLNKGNAQFIETSKRLLSFPTNNYYYVCVPFDMDRDDDADILVVGGPYGPDTGYVFRNLNPYVFSTKVLFAALLQAPAKGATGVGASVVLRWTDQNKKPYPEETQYQVRIKLAGGNYTYYNVKKGRAYLQLNGLAAVATYSWNVKAVGNGKDIKDSEWAVSGNDWTFTTK